MIRPERGTGQKGFVNNKIYTHTRTHACTHSYSKTQVVLIIKLVCMLWTGVVHPYNSTVLYCHFYVLCVRLCTCAPYNYVYIIIIFVCVCVCAYSFVLFTRKVFVFSLVLGN